jgi:hypothetical protein
MTRPRFGEALARFVTLSPHDVSEILEEQSSSRRRFGDIALAFGLCKPQHVWRAWWAQLSGAPALAIEYNVIPIRASGSQVVMAAAEGSLMRAMEELPRRVKNQIKFVLADSRQIHQAIENYYANTASEKKTEPMAIPA